MKCKRCGLGFNRHQDHLGCFKKSTLDIRNIGKNQRMHSIHAHEVKELNEINKESHT